MPLADQLVKLLKHVIDEETGYQFPSGTIGTVDRYLNESWCLVSVENRVAEPSDCGTGWVVVNLVDLLAI